MKTAIILLLFTSVVLITGISNSTKQEDVPATIIAMERAALERWGNGDPSGYLEITAPEETYFDPSLELRKDGLDALKAYYEPIRGEVSIDEYKMINPRVQVHGDTAVLTFNLVDWNTSEGVKHESRWNSTEVYHRFDEGWRIIHSHWSYTIAEPK